jgi:K+-transporting ATPase KdpF subunit
MREAQVTALYGLGLFIAAALFVYLLIALLAPERFQ